MKDERCACGKPLHYMNPEAEALVRKTIALVGDDYVIVQVLNGRRFRVQRHYIALHGVNADALSSLGFEEILS